MSVLIFSTVLPETFLILRGTERDITVNVHRAPCKVTLLFLPDFYGTWILSIYFWKKIKISNFVNIRPLGGGLFVPWIRTDRHTRRSY